MRLGNIRRILLFGFAIVCVTSCSTTETDSSTLLSTDALPLSGSGTMLPGQKPGVSILRTKIQRVCNLSAIELYFESSSAFVHADGTLGPEQPPVTNLTLMYSYDRTVGTKSCGRTNFCAHTIKFLGTCSPAYCAKATGINNIDMPTESVVLHGTTTCPVPGSW